jgi:hypothetical protein
MAGGTFFARMDELSAMVGVGSLTARVEFDQIYAHRQHEDLTLKHVIGGPKFLERALYENIPEFLQLVANSVLRDGPKSGMIFVAEDLASKAANNAPKRVIGDRVLSNSAHPVVIDDGTVVYDRAPVDGRISKEEIKERNEAFQIDPKHWYGRWPRVIGGPTT